MKKLTKRQIALWAVLTDEQLQTAWQNIGNNPDNLVKTGRNKGQLKMSVIKHSDLLLAELNRRNVTP